MAFDSVIKNLLVQRALLRVEEGKITNKDKQKEIAKKIEEINKSLTKLRRFS